MKKISILISVIIISGLARLSAQDRFPNTLAADSASPAPTATLDDMQWIQGHWKGRAFGGITEEVWTPPLGGSMMGAFKLVRDGKVNFYEMVVITEENESLMLRLKHFHWDLKGWEEKDETVDFPLVKVTRDKVYFDGFTFEKAGENEMNIYVIIQDQEGRKEQKFTYHRVRQDK